MQLADRIWAYLWDHHDLQRWPVQIQLSQRLRHCLTSLRTPTVGLYEAPTGSGKTLAMLIEALGFARS